MSNTTLNRLLDLPDFLRRHAIIHSEGFSFDMKWVDRVIRSFESSSAMVAINYPIVFYIEGICYKGELEVRRDGSHAVHMAH